MKQSFEFVEVNQNNKYILDNVLEYYQHEFNEFYNFFDDLNENGRYELITTDKYILDINYNAFLIYKNGKIAGFIIDDHFKLYLSDIGILVNMLQVKYNDIILDNLLQYKGIISENYVATQLVAKNIPLMYWESGNQAEIDFILYNNDGIIPIEVKANDNVGSQSLNVYIKRYQPKYAIRISTKNFGFSNNNIKSIPLYATFCIK